MTRDRKYLDKNGEYSVRTHLLELESTNRTHVAKASMENAEQVSKLRRDMKIGAALLVGAAVVKFILAEK